MYNKTEKMLQKSLEIAAYMSLEIARELERKDDEDAAAEDDEADVNMRSMRSKKKHARARLDRWRKKKKTKFFKKEKGLKWGPVLRESFAFHFPREMSTLLKLRWRHQALNTDLREKRKTLKLE